MKPRQILSVQQDTLPENNGDIGKLIRSLDWSKTPLGKIESWPENLRMAIDIIVEEINDLSRPVSKFNSSNDVFSTNKTIGSWPHIEKQKILSLLPAGVYTCDAEGRITFFNSRAAELWGRTPNLNDDEEKFCACYKVWMSDGTLIKPDKTPMAIAIKSGQSFRNVEALVERPDGSQFYAAVNIDPLFDEENRICGAINVFQDITELKNARGAVRTKEAQLQLITDSAPVYLSHCDRNHQFIFVNEPYAARFGLKPEQIIGKSVLEILGEEAFEKILPYMQRALAGEKVNYEAEVNYKDIGRRFMRISYEPDIDEENNVRGYVGAVIDITDRRLWEETLRESERRYRQLALSLPAAFYTTDASGCITLYNDAAVELWGKEPEIGKDLWCGSHRIYRANGEPLPVDECPMALTIKEGRAIHGHEIIIERPDGVRRNVLPYPQPIIGGANEIVGFINMLIDITDRKQAEQALSESDARFTRFMQHLPGLAWIKDANGKYIFANEAAVKTFGLPLSDLCGKTDVEIFPPETAEQFKTNDQAVMHTKSGIQTIETLRHEDGKVHHSIVSKFPIPAIGNGSTLIGGIAIDITERKLAEEKLRLRSERMQLLSETLGKLLNARDLENLVHELFPKVAQHLGVDVSYFNFMVNEKGDGLYLHSYSGISEEVAASIRNLKFGEGICGVVAQTCTAIIANNIQQTTDTRADLVRGFGVQTYACNPLLTGGRLLGTLSFASCERQSFDEDELEFLRIISQYTAVAIDRLQTAKALHEAKNELELRVRERTKELVEANAKYQAIYEQGIFAGLLNLDGVLVDANHSSLESCGFTREQVIGKPFWEAGWWNRSAEVQAWIKAGFNQALEGYPFHGESIYFAADGSKRVVDFALMPIKDEAGKVLYIVPTGIDITDRKRLEQQRLAADVLRESEEKFRHMADNAPVLMWISDTSKKCTWFNQRWLDFVGSSLEQEIKHGHVRNIHSDDAGRSLKIYYEAFEVKQPFKMEYRLRRRDGQYRWILDHGIPIYGKSGEFSGYIGSCIDITERRYAEAALRESEERFRLAIDAGNVGTWDWDIVTNRVTWSDQIYKFHGLMPGSFDGKVESFAKLLHPEDKERVNLAIKHSIETLGPYSIEMRIIRPNGEIRWILTNGRVLVDNNGRALRMLGATVDITDQRKAEETLLAQTRSLEIINHVGTAIAAELDLTNLVQSITDAAREISKAEFAAFFYNVKNEQGESFTLYTLSGAPREAFEKFGQPRNTPLFASTFKGEGVTRIADVLEDPRYGKVGPHYGMPQGHLPVRSYLAVPVISRSGEVIGGLFFGHSKPNMFTEEAEKIIVSIAAQAAVAIDNARLYQAVQKELKQHKHMEEKLSRSNHELEQFAYVASHDLQEPLHMIMSFTDLLSRRTEKKLEPKEKEYLDFIYEGASQAKMLIREILEYSRIGKDKNFQTVNTESVIKQVMSNLKASAEEAGATIEYDSLPRVKANHLELTQLFQNLISNAIKYRQGSPRVKVVAKRNKDKWLFSVQDNGIGIAPEYKEKIFLMFQRLHAKSEYSGTGIGLAICKKIVEHHGGKIWVESEAGQGSTFYFTINV